ncbi:PP2C family protein-serine/threonine phosphatase [Neoactinobaculum massilliense]|uniref:PP2C family protein-serine/threonine phosphatase n=1 Tax=Neoactinobaculum massilliense TaxID=2364794 RepID=UPI000F521301|nr:protein phosphatase 2C domain-containing protein [Neoactinobaculum massilliense]
MISFEFAAASDVGLVRANNEDSGFASTHLLVLADGMGGAAAGDVASAISVAHLRSLDAEIPAADMLPRLRATVADAQQDMLARVAAQPRMAGMGTTTIALLRSGSDLALVHIGDSRAYRLRDNKLEQMTKDHTLVQYLVDHGKITAEQAKTHPRRNVIMRALGDNEGATKLDESRLDARVGDRWILCSDGLSGVVRSQTIAQALRTIPDLNELAEHLIGLALAAGAPDNVTVVLGEVVDRPDPVTRPSITVGSAAEELRGAPAGSTTAVLPAVSMPDAYGTAETSADADAEADRTPAARSRATQSHATQPVAESLSPRRRRFAWIFAIATMLVALGVLGGAAYSWSQSRYYITEDAGEVTIYQGIPQTVGAWSFSHVAERTGLAVDTLTPVARERLQTPVVRGSLESAQDFVESLRTTQVEPSPTASPDASSPATTVSPATTASPSVTPTPTTTPRGGTK